MKKILGVLTIALALVTLTGCGLKGPLYFPSAGGKPQNTTHTADSSNAEQTVPVRNDRGVGDGPTQVNY